MRRYKILIGLVWACLMALSPVRGQAIVHDPVHMGSNVVGFGQELQEALTQTEQFFQIITNTKQQFASIEKIREITDKVSAYVMFMREIEDIARMAVSTINNISDGVKILSCGELEPYEINSVLRLYSSSLGQVNYLILSGKQFVSDGLRLTTNERIERIEKLKRQMQSEMDKNADLNARIETAIKYHRKFDRIVKNASKSQQIKLLQYLPSVAQPMNIEGSLPIMDRSDLSSLLDEMSFTFDENSFRPTLRETASVTETANKYKSNTTSAAKMFYLVSAIIGIIGALRVLQIWNQGNDISKAMVAWGGTSLFLVLTGYFIQLFFK